ncbi:DinB family protein [Desulfomicrobium sp. ZS1]|uniref:DinB family protein n=1 Tax=Desulfomicrobium sp. ZS1 TaxID=2952228 RepID=UPI0020B33AA8|nr:DinB family protein [Desulfomicrobium sp. ZS1]UTF51669.1 DinB family protein [Desulfomicrobium sp. ZS1]
MNLDCVDCKARIDSFEALMTEHGNLADIRLAPDKWTLKEMIAHLIDSASNNHQRFIRMQLEPVLIFPKYDAEEWKNTTKITSFDYATLVTLWKTYNTLLMHLIENVNPAALNHVWRREDKDISLEALIHDYFAHMELHRTMFEERVEEIKR